MQQLVQRSALDRAEVVVENHVLFHGSKTQGITQLRPSTVGYLGPGIYLTSDRARAYKYTTSWARHMLRQEVKHGPIYECEVADARMLDLKSASFTLREVVAEIRSRLARIAEEPNTTAGIAAKAKGLAASRLEAGQPNFNRALQLLGFDGIVSGALWLVFDPGKVRIIRESEVEAMPGQISMLQFLRKLA